MTQTSPAAARQLDAIPVHRKSLSQRLRENWQLYVMLLIPVVLTIVYKYWPMYGIQIAFRDFKASRGQSPAASGLACTGLNGSSPHPTVCA